MIDLSARSTETTVHHAETTGTVLLAISIATTDLLAETSVTIAHPAATLATTDHLVETTVATIAHHVATTKADLHGVHTAAVADSDQVAAAVDPAAVADTAADQAVDAQVAAVDSDPAVAQVAAAADSVAHEIEIDDKVGSRKSEVGSASDLPTSNFQPPT
jgi:hypothetical protein